MVFYFYQHHNKRKMGSEYICEISSEIRELIDSYKDSADQFDSEGHIASEKFRIELNQEIVFTDEEIKRLKEKKVLFQEVNESRRCRKALACITKDTLAGNDGSGTSAQPSGFQAVEKYMDSIFHRCHLIGYHLFGKMDDEKGSENSNLKKLFIGTCFMNNVMYSYEKRVSEYVEGTENYVLYRVTPYFEGDNQLAYGVQMEAKCFNKENEEDKENSFNVFVYNKQPGIVLNCHTGEVSVEKSKEMIRKIMETEDNYVINAKSKIFHLESCGSVSYMNGENRREHDGNRDQLMEEKHRACAICDLKSMLDVLEK